MSWVEGGGGLRTSLCATTARILQALNRWQMKLTDFPIVARSLSSTGETALSTVRIHIPRHSLDDDEASISSEPGEESAFHDPPPAF